MPPNWTDEQLNEQARRVDGLSEDVVRIGPAVDNLTEEMRAIRQTLADEARSLRKTMTAQNRSIRQDFTALQGRLTQIGFGLVGAVLASAVAVIIAVAPL